MKVLYITNSTDLTGGDTKSFLTLLDGIVQKGVSPYIVTPNKEGLYKLLQEKNIPVCSINYRMNIYPNFATPKDFLLFIPRLVCRRIIEKIAIRKISRLIKKMNFDIVHSNVSVLSCGQAAARKLGVPHIFHVREYADRDFGFRHYPTKRAYYRRLNQPHSYTICITKGIQEYHKLNGSKSRLIYDGFPTETKVRHSEFQKEKFFFFAGRIEPTKGLMQALEAYRIFCALNKENDIMFKFAGVTNDQQYTEEVQSYLSVHNLNDRAQYVGVRRDIDALMQDAQATIIASKFEAFGRCLPEAMLNNCITIGRNVGGTKEQYDNGVLECGEEIGLRYETTEELAARMTEVYTSSNEKFDTMKMRARDTVRSLYSEKRHVNNVYSFYQDILSDKISCE